MMMAVRKLFRVCTVNAGIRLGDVSDIYDNNGGSGGAFRLFCYWIDTALVVPDSSRL